MEIKKKGKNRIKERANDTIVVVRFHRLNEHLTGLIIPPGEIITRLNIHNRWLGNGFSNRASIKQQLSNL